MANMMMTIMCTGIYLVFDFFHFQKKYIPTPDRAYIPMNIYIGFTLSPKRYAMRRLVAVLNYFSSFTNDDLITFLPSSNMMVRLALFPSAISVIVPSPKTLCLILSPMSNSAIYLSSLSMPKFNNNNKLLSQNIYQSVHSNMNRGADISLCIIIPFIIFIRIILNKFPIISFRVIKINPFSMGMIIGDSGILIPGRI